jgi:hypothetical protein
MLYSAEVSKYVQLYILPHVSYLRLGICMYVVWLSITIYIYIYTAVCAEVCWRSPEPQKRTLYYRCCFSWFRRNRWPTKAIFSPLLALPENHLAEYWRTNCHMFKKMKFNDLPNLEEKDFTDGRYCVLQLLCGGHLMGKRARRVARMGSHQKEEKFLNIQLHTYFTALFISFIYLFIYSVYVKLYTFRAVVLYKLIYF